MNRKIVLLSTAILVVITALVIGSLSQTVNANTPNNASISSETVKYTCSMSVDQIQNTALANGYKLPKYVPTGYSMQDGSATKGVLSVYYAKSSICGSTNVTSTDVIRYIIADTTSGYADSIKKGSQYFQEFKAHTDKPQYVSLFEINGKPAMGWESGMKKDIIRWDNGTVISSHDVPYPAQMQVIDPSGNFYLFKGYTTLDELKKIAQSIV